MKKWIVMMAAFAALVIGLCISVRRSSQLSADWQRAEANVKAYGELLSTEKDKSVAYQLTAEQLSFTKDSVIQELDKVRKQLKIKDKDLKAVQRVSSSFSRTDTVIVSDTIFRDKTITVDTLIGDEWYQARLHLQYPSTVIISPKFKSEKDIVVYTRKQTINPPKKFWLLRLFQKKHRVLTVVVREKNPYASDEESRYVEVVK